jgi:hypothetical protein
MTLVTISDIAGARTAAIALSTGFDQIVVLITSTRFIVSLSVSSDLIIKLSLECVRIGQFSRFFIGSAAL